MARHHGQGLRTLQQTLYRGWLPCGAARGTVQRMRRSARTLVLVTLFAAVARAAPPGRTPPKPAAKPAAAPEPLPPPARQDALTEALQTALDLHRNGDTAGALKQVLLAEEEARARLPLVLSNGNVLSDVPENLGMYKPAPGSMVFNQTALFYLEVENFGLRKRPDGLEVDLWTDLWILHDDGERIGGKERFGEHRFTARAPYRRTHMALEAAINGLPPGAYLAQVVVHDAVSGKQGETRIPFRVATRPGQK